MALLKRYRLLLGMGLLAVLGLGCDMIAPDPTPTVPPPPTGTIPIVITEPPTLTSTIMASEGTATADLVSTPTLAPTEEATAVPTVDINTDIEYRVVHVDENDILNVRSGPGASHDVVTDLAPGTAGVRVVGFGQTVNDSVWVPINIDTSSGWVNSRFLTQDISGEEFCNDPEPAALLDQLRQAIQDRDGNLLAEIGNPERGLRFRHYWHEEGVRFENQQVNNLFNLTRSYFWGVEDGSGEDINGSFSDVILPLLERNLIQSTATACNEILHGGTAGLVQLPFRYEGINYYSLYHPAPADNEFDWGTWVVGIERWQDDYFVSFLVHYQWEI